jgi:hypothetical protein
MLNPTRVKVLKPLRICHFVLEVGDEFDITNWQETAFGTFFQPVNVDGMDSGMSWLFTEKTFEAVEWESEWQPSEDMDGDFDSAMRSAGFGTDEDYGYFGE